MNEHINPVVEIKRLDAESKDLYSIVKEMAVKFNEQNEDVKRLRFDLDEFMTNIKEDKSDKAVSSALKRLDHDINKVLGIFGETQNKNDEEFQNIWHSVLDLEKFMNEERFKPIFDKLKQLEKDTKQKALEIIQQSFNDDT